MEDIKDYLEFKISGLKFDLNMTLENFYNEKGIDNFTYPYEIMDEIKNNIIEDGVKDEVETTSIGYKYLIRNFGNKQDESTEFFYFKMMIYLSFCDFYLERNKERVQSRWYNKSTKVIFNIEDLSGEFQIKCFLRDVEIRNNRSFKSDILAINV